MRATGRAVHALRSQALCNQLTGSLGRIFTIASFLAGNHGLLSSGQARLQLTLGGQQLIHLGPRLGVHLAQVGALCVYLLVLSFDLVAHSFQAGIQFSDLLFEVAHCDSPWRILVSSFAARRAAERSGATARGVSVGAALCVPPPAALGMLDLKLANNSRRWERGMPALASATSMAFIALA